MAVMKDVVCHSIHMSIIVMIINFMCMLRTSLLGNLLLRIKTNPVLLGYHCQCAATVGNKFPPHVYNCKLLIIK